MFLNSDLTKTIFLCGELNQDNSATVVKELKSIWPQHDIIILTTHNYLNGSDTIISLFLENPPYKLDSLTLNQFLGTLSQCLYEKIQLIHSNHLRIDCQVHFILLPEWFNNRVLDIDSNNSIQILKQALTTNKNKMYYYENCARDKFCFDPISAIYFDDLHLFDEFITRLASNNNTSKYAFSQIFQLSARVMS